MEAAAAGDTLDPSANTVAMLHTQEHKARARKHPHSSSRNAPSITAHFETPEAILHQVSSSVDQLVLRMVMVETGTRELQPRKSSRFAQKPMGALGEKTNSRTV